MFESKFLQIHTLHSYPAALLNRDDSGLAKRMSFGGAIRTRVSSQSLKWHWRGRTIRTADGMAYEDREFGLDKIGVQMGQRSRNAVDERIISPLEDQFPPELMGKVRDVFNKGVYGDSGTSRESRQPLLLGLPEVEYLREKAREFCENDANEDAADAAKSFFDNYDSNFHAMREHLKAGLAIGRHGGLEGALFGRMVTSDPASNIDASIHVAHAFTVHEQETEDEYFTAVDDLQRLGEETGASFIGDTELTAGLFYGYVVVDVPDLISNLEGCQSVDWLNEDRDLAAKVVEHLIHLIATVSPGAKLGSTAPYGRARFMLIESGSSQPYSLADAFRKPVPAQMEAALCALKTEIEGQDACYGVKGVRRFMSMTDCEILDAKSLCLDDLASWAAGAVRDGEAA